MANIRIGRRDLLRGIGAGAALLGPFARSAESWAAGPPGNLAVFYTPNGFVRKNFNFTGALSAAAAYQKQITIVQNMKCSAASSKASHEDIVKILTCAPGGGLYSTTAPSVDWIVAQHFKQQPMTLAALGGKGPDWNTKLSWKAAGSFDPHTNSPSAAFDRIFAGGVPMTGGTPTTPTTPGMPAMPNRAAEQDKSVLDFVAEDIRTLQARLAPADASKLKDHLDVIRDLEVKLQAGTPTGGGAVTPVTSPAGPPVCNSGAAKTAAASASSMQQTIEAQMDVMAAAFACGVRRVGTLLTQPASSGTNPLGGGSNHHNITHAHNYAVWSNIDKWYGERFNYFLKKLDSLRILDRTIVVWVSEIEEEHLLSKMYWAVAGGGALGMKLGNTISAPDVGNLWVSVRKALGVPGDQHGSISGGISDLFAG